MNGIESDTESGIYIDSESESERDAVREPVREPVRLPVREPEGKISISI